MLASLACFRKVCLPNVPLTSAPCNLHLVEKIGDRIRRFRLLRSIKSRAALARRLQTEHGLKISAEMLRLYEVGKHDPPRTVRKALAAVFEVEERDLEFGDQPLSSLARLAPGSSFEIDPHAVLALVGAIKRNVDALIVLCSPAASNEYLESHGIRRPEEGPSRPPTEKKSA